MDSAHRNSLQPGHLVHWFKIERILGQGGFGITYLAIDTNLNRQVAIKEYLPVEIAVRDSNNSLYPISDNRSDQYSFGLSRFIEEAQTLAKFDHHNIVRVVTVFEANNTAYMVMRYEEGECLDNILKARKTLNEKTLKNILFPILDGLEKVHAEGFIHRDIKPANIYIRMDGSPVLLDFGAARQSLGEATKTLTSMVSSGYAPFEQYFSKSDQQGPWTDIYGLGATIYRGITSVMPMDAVDRSNTILQLSRDTFVYAAEIGQEKYSEAFLKAVDSALQFKYQDRPQSIADWRSEFKLQKFIAEDKPAIKVKQKDIPTKEATKTNNTPQIKSIAKPKKARLKPMIAAVASIVIAIFVSSYFLYSELGFNLKKENEKLTQNKVLTAQEEIELKREELKLLEEKAEQKRIAAEALAKLEEENRRKAAEVKLRIEKETEAKKKQINTLLSTAEDDIKANRLIFPKGNNAYEKYSKVLEFSLEHPGAKAGIAKIGSIYITEAKTAINDNDFERADNLLIEADKIIPGSARIKKAQLLLSGAKEKHRLAEQRRIAEAKAKKEEAEKQLKIKSLLTEADESIKAKRFIEPANNNALATYKKVLALSPNHPDALKGISNVANELAIEAKDLISKKDFSAAQNTITQALQVDPKSKEIKNTQSMLNSTIARKKQEEARLKEAQKRAEEKAKKEEAEKQLKIKTLLTEADKSIKAKRLTGPKDNNALATYKKVLALSPNHPDALKGISNVAIALVSEAKYLISKKDFSAAQNTITQALQIDPKSKEVKNAQTMLVSAIAKNEQEQARLKEAQMLAEEKARDEEVNRLIVEINSAVENQDFELAKKLLAEANTLDSGSVNLKNTNKNYETQYSHLQQEQKRIEQVKQLLISAKNNVDKNRLSTPKGNNALEQYQKVLILEPENETAKAGVQNVFSQYIALAQESIKAESYQKGKDYLDIAQKIIPESQEVKTILDELTPKLAEIEKIEKEEEIKAAKLAEEIRIAEQKKLEEEAETKRLAEERKLAEANAAKQLEKKRLAEEEAAKQAKNSKAGEFVKIPGGTLKSVTIEPFEMGKYEITQGQWKSVMGSNPSQNKNCGDKCPVENVKWDEVQDFIKKLNSESGVKYRLPTATEWEYACALGGSKDQCTGSNIHALFLGSGLKQGQNKPVGYAPPDSSGVANLRDQIWEWTCSKYSSTSTGRDAECEYKDKYVTHAVRGGKSVYVDLNSATALRNWNNYALRYPVIGFRLVVSK